MLSLSEANDLLIIHADNYSETDLNIMHNLHKSEKKGDNKIEATILGFNSTDYKSCGFMQFDENNVLQDFIEKPMRKVEGVANAAIFTCSRGILEELVVENKSFDFCAECLPKLIGRAAVYETDRLHIDVGSMERLIQVNKNAKPVIEKYKSQRKLV